MMHALLHLTRDTSVILLNSISLTSSENISVTNQRIFRTGKQQLYSNSIDLLDSICTVNNKIDQPAG